MSRIVPCLIVALTLPLSAFAQTETKHIDFVEDVPIVGTRDAPMMDQIVAQNHARLGKLIRLRDNFNEKCLESVSDL